MWMKLNDSWYWIRGTVQYGPFATKSEGQAWLKEQEAA